VLDSTRFCPLPCWFGLPTTEHPRKSAASPSNLYIGWYHWKSFRPKVTRWMLCCCHANESTSLCRSRSTRTLQIPLNNSHQCHLGSRLTRRYPRDIPSLNRPSSIRTLAKIPSAWQKSTHFLNRLLRSFRTSLVTWMKMKSWNGR